MTHVERPFVYVNMAMSADGKITSASREYPRFTSAADKQNMDRLRAEADAIMIGAGTLRADNPRLGVRDAEMQAYRRSLGKQPGLQRVVVTSSLELDLDSRFFDEADGGDRIVATVEDVPEERLAAVRARAEILQVGRGRVDMVELLGRLRRRGVERLLCEGGGELNWALVRDDLVDELHVTVAPVLLGGREAPTLLEGEGFSMKQQRRLSLVETRRDGGELFCRYAVVR